ncbi:mitochondrial transcription rescue factor 1-like [Lytechinus variegatus]|uniref:mitochondrial transcription rescue factor 1-like n=1 Tax=Lytechinus variegatus TaxID=7654 RepID=UPI001BB1CF48|nr:mitochondrial transcription rescue factor 1-like [Lytechinus variegatus]
MMGVSLYRLSSFVLQGKSSFMLHPPFFKYTRCFSLYSARFSSICLPSQTHGKCREVERSAQSQIRCRVIPKTTMNQSKFLAVEPTSLLNKLVCYYSKKSKSKQKLMKGDSTDDESDLDEENGYKSDSEDEDEIEDGSKKDWKDLKMNVPSRRIDAVLSAGLGVSRKKIEEAFLNAKLRHNGKKVMKKSRQVQEGDVLDVVKEDRITNKEGNQVTLVMRVEMKKIKEEKTSTDKTPVKLRRWKHLELPREK